MAKKKTNIRGKLKGKPERRSWWRTIPRFMMRPLAWRSIVVLLIVVLLFWYWSTLASWAASIRDLLGWGLLFIAMAVGVLVWLVRRRKLSLLIHNWNQWLAGIALILAAWGILALINQNLGGTVGSAIIGNPDLMGALRILGLLILSVVLVAPGTCYRLVTRPVLWLKKQTARLLAPRPALKLKQAPPPPPAKVTPQFPEAKTERKAATPIPAPAPTRQELRQVAQEVWKKYGESSKTVVVDGWRLPPIDILDKSTEVEFSQADNAQRATLIEEALASYGVDARVVQINAGPTVTQFGVEPGWDVKRKEVRERDPDGNINVRSEEVSRTRVKVDRITSLANDLALALASPSIRIEAPVPGQSVVGIEMPNVASSIVSLRGVIETTAFQKTEARSKLCLALGEGAGGEAIAADLARMPHLLIAGATGSGKTVCLNSAICCLLIHNTPNDIRFIMIDPKRVELTPFNSIPHLAAPVIVDTDRALQSLRWLNQEMDKRYQMMARASARNIEAYNNNRQGDERLPYLVLIIDELADLMMAGFDEVEHILCRLAQLARATGIHLIVATQRPSVDVVTGLIKANFPTRISFAVTSQVDSRTILDGGGAEKLLGKGDMLFMPTEAAKPKRLQGCFVSDAETERLVYFWGSQRREELAQLKIEAPIQAPATVAPPTDPLLEAARQLAEEHPQISTSYLQRKLRIGYPRAARIMEQLEEEESSEGEEDS